MVVKVTKGWPKTVNADAQQGCELRPQEIRAYTMLGPFTGNNYGGTLRHEYRYSASANDGRAVSYKNWQSGEDVQYTYDSLARLTKAETLGPDWGQSFGYDGWGNLLSKSVTKGSAPVMKRHGGRGDQSVGGLRDSV